MDANHRMPPPSPRSYEDYENLGQAFEEARRPLAYGKYNEAAEALKNLQGQSWLMWMPPFPLQVSELGKLKDDIENSRTYPPHGNFEKRLEEFRGFVRSQYKKNRQQAQQQNESFVPKDKPDPPAFLN